MLFEMGKGLTELNSRLSKLESGERPSQDSAQLEELDVDLEAKKLAKGKKEEQIKPSRGEREEALLTALLELLEEKQPRLEDARQLIRERLREMEMAKIFGWQTLETLNKLEKLKLQPGEMERLKQAHELSSFLQTTKKMSKPEKDGRNGFGKKPFKKKNNFKPKGASGSDKQKK